MWKKIVDTKDFHNCHQITLANGRDFVVGILPVIYGYRVIGTYNDEQTYEMNWCCGDNKLVLFATQQVLMNVIEQRGNRIDGIPFMSNIKPWFKDEEFIDRVCQLTNNNALRDIIKLIAEPQRIDPPTAAQSA